MTDASTLRAEIKAWERAFKAEYGRTPSVQDIKDNPEIAAKYKQHKRLAKAESSSVTFNKVFPRTPSPKPSSSRAQPSIVPKTPAVHSQFSTSANPFSPTKKVLRNTKRLTPISRSPSPNGDYVPHRPGSQTRFQTTEIPSSSTPSTEALPTEPALSIGVAGKARKRLRGDPVSPSPNRPEKKSRIAKRSGSPMNVEFDGASSSAAVEADSSFFDDSPVKPSGGKDFKALFDEDRMDMSDDRREKPLARLLFSATPLPSSLASSAPVLGQKEMLKDRLKSRPKQNSALNNHSRRYLENTLEKVGEDGQMVIVPSIQRGQKSSSSQGPQEPDVAPSQPSKPAVNTLLPPSPTQFSKSAPKTSKASMNRKKVKHLESNDSEEEKGNDDDIFVVDLDIQDLRRRHTADDADSDADVGDAILFNNHTSGQVDAIAEHGESDPEPEINLPDEMRQILHISSSRARKREEIDLVESLLRGRRRGVGVTRGEIWGVGEGEEEEDGGITEGDEDWAGEGLPWEAAELSD